MSRIQFVGYLIGELKIYYVRDQFGRTWKTVASNKQEAKQNILFGEDVTTYKVYTTKKAGERLPQYDFKNLILDMLELMDLHNTYEYEIVISWSDYDAYRFMLQSSLLPCDLLLDISKFQGGVEQ